MSTCVPQSIHVEVRGQRLESAASFRRVCRLDAERLCVLSHLSSCFCTALSYSRAILAKVRRAARMPGTAPNVSYAKQHFPTTTERILLSILSFTVNKSKSLGMV